MGTRPDFDEWVAARGQSLLRLAYALTGSRAEAEDIVEHALSRALARWSRISRRDPDTYVRRLVVHAHLSRWRGFRRRQPPPPPPVEQAPTTGIAIAVPDPMWHACESLPPEQRTALVLRFYEDLRYDEIAELTGVREASIRSSVAGGIAAIRAAVSEP